MDSVFKEIYTKHHQDIFHFLFYLVKNRELAEDLVQEVYIRVLKSYDRFEGKSTLKTWLLSIARNVAIDHFRKENTLKNKLFSRTDWKDYDIQDKRPIPEEVVIENETIGLLYRCLDLCTVDQRVVIICRYIQDLSISETAEILGWTESKVKTTQHRAIKALKKQMNRLLEKEGEI
ncbi:RNA polymerase sigma factor SigX [Caldibacillus lycopersici]|uniref:RNA polymerase sigma factor n=1 Tax=Perspicuibacillus lycopersici TaxID=1325689 RepID=A0AAE3IUP7_9BACI|nr:RNA polymerase sigma factor SigX [Perspicuibacillus lycopersici]MCU9613744.1 RNA polymerase sigma factor SigX [Perspicuibacillus lycopersici]